MEPGIILAEKGWIACQYQALKCYSKMLAAKGEQEQAKEFLNKAEDLKAFFNKKWGVKKGRREYVRGYDVKGNAPTNWGLENSWFMPMKFITEPSEKNDAYLDFIARCMDTRWGRPSNLEAITYIPGVFFPYNRVADAWKWLEYIIDQPDKEYPEVSYTLISHIVEGMLGFEPNAPESSFLTAPRLPSAVADLCISQIPLGDHRLTISHEGISKSTATHVSGNKPLKWEACFYGDHSTILVNGKESRSTKRRLHGVNVTSVIIEIAPGQAATASVQ